MMNAVAAAYGLFQVVFANLAEHLSIATFRLRKHREPDLALETVFRQEFGRTLKQFREELDRFEDQPSASDNLDALRAACNVMSGLARWRNERIHARVQLTERGYALYDWRTHQPLTITPEQIEQNIQRAIETIGEFKAYASHLVELLDWDKEFERFYNSLPQPSDADDG